MDVLQTRVVSQFVCTGDACPDTCCKGWGMQLTRETVNKYAAEAPELLEAVTSGEAEHIMKRDPATDFCVKFEAGWCGIHKAYGEEMLGDACHFFPRVTRRLGEKVVMTASMSCPEIARLSLREDGPTEAVNTEMQRLPFSLKDYALDGLDAQAMYGMHAAFIAHVRAHALQPERAMMHVVSVSRSLDLLPVEQWQAALGFYLRMADGRLPPPEPVASDPFNLLNALQGLVGAAKTTARPRLMRSIDAMAEMLGATLDWQTLGISLSDDSAMRYLRMQAFWREHCAAYYAPILVRWLEAQLSLNLFPFAGLGQDFASRATIVAVRFATVKLALMARAMQEQRVLDEAELVEVVQGIARFLDHLADPTLSLRIYEELGWMREARLRALLGDA